MLSVSLFFLSVLRAARALFRSSLRGLGLLPLVTALRDLGLLDPPLISFSFSSTLMFLRLRLERRRLREDGSPLASPSSSSKSLRDLLLFFDEDTSEAAVLLTSLSPPRRLRRLRRTLEDFTADWVDITSSSSL